MSCPIVVRFDAWLGKKLFLPLIIRACQTLRWTQHRFNRMCYLAAALLGLYCAHAITMKVFYGLGALLLCLCAGLLPDDWPERSSRWFRLLWCFAFVLGMFKPDWHIAFDLLILFAEYAATIRTIPPLESKRREAKRAVAHARI